ncbi:MAG: monofunctional biosynthetic peptidoglycan transglycosylase [Bacteroidia bacterium]
MAGKTVKRIKNFFTKTWRFFFHLILLGFQLTVFFIILYRAVPVPVTPLQIERLVEQITEGRSMKLNKTWKSIDYVSDKFCQSVMLAEDVKFLEHYGFDFEQIQKAIDGTFEKGKKLRGASTITQQTAKNIFFTPKRSWVRKAPEVIITVLLEALWTKKRILEVYINIIEMGEGIYGVEAASQNYFRKSSSSLTSRESALLASCLPNPRRWTPDKPTRFINKKAGIVQHYLPYIGKLPWR